MCVYASTSVRNFSPHLMTVCVCAFTPRHPPCEPVCVCLSVCTFSFTLLYTQLANQCVCVSVCMSVCALLPLHPPREPVLHGSVLWVWLLCPDNLRARVCIHTCLHMFCLFVLNCVSVRAIAHGDCVNQRVHAHVLDCVSQRVHAHVLDCVSQCAHAHVSAYVLCVCLCLTVCLCVRLHTMTV